MSVQTMQALLVTSSDTASVSTIPLPEPGPHEIRIKVQAVALNPVDSLYLSFVGRTVGSDVAGVVDKVGSDVKPRSPSEWGTWNIDDRVAGLLQGATTRTDRSGAFAEYAILEADLVFLIPAGLSFEEAASVPLSALTTAQTLYIKLGFPSPFAMPEDLVVPSKANNHDALLLYSAATTLGLFALSFFRAHNPLSIKIFATASTKHHATLLSLGVDQVFDYRDPTWPEKAKEASGDTVAYGYDTISEDESTSLVSRALCDNGGTISVVRAAAWSKEGIKASVRPVYSAVWSGLGHQIIYNGQTLPANKPWRDFSVNFYRWLSYHTTPEGTLPIETIPIRFMPGGIERIPLDGFALLGRGKVADRARNTDDQHEPWMKPISGEKLVYKI